MTGVQTCALPISEQSANEVRSRIEGLGAVNAAAMEEYQEAQQRHDFLSAQRQDLIDSIRDTEKAIQEIDLVSRQKFSEAFEAINALLRILWPAWGRFEAGSAVCFMFFWFLNIVVIWRGIETIKFLEGIGAPFMLAIGVLLLWWITRKEIGRAHV